MNLKSIFIAIISLSTLNVLAEVIQPDHWEIISTQQDTTLDSNQSKLSITVLDNTGKPHKNATVYINTLSLLGITNKKGFFESTLNSGTHKICADTKEGNGFIRVHTFQPKYHYTIKIWMSALKSTTLVPYPETTPNTPIALKPVIYLYPEQTQKVNVGIKPNSGFSFSYPAYPRGGWNVTAQPNGQLTHQNKTLNYLFWEGPLNSIPQFDLTTGFYVHSDTVVQFLEHTLTKVGLSEIEQADFITFWAPRLIQNDLNFIHFEFNDGYDKLVASIKLDPQPETLIRLFMVFKPVNKTLPIKQQTIPTNPRKGFTVVEWGGSQIQ
jgi:hypothetical protein